MIFPSLKNKKFGYVNLNLESQKWTETHPGSSLVDPTVCEKMVLDVHKKYSIDFSYGGWMEDRSFLWHGSYLDTWGEYIHLGVDLNVPTGTSVAADFDAKVIAIEDDYPEVGGWGPTVTLKHATKPVYLLYAHLDRNILCKPGDLLKAGTVFATVGKAPFNGNWFPHLHVQVISSSFYEEIEKKKAWKEIDGYGSAEEIEDHAKHFADPMQYISLT